MSIPGLRSKLRQYFFLSMAKEYTPKQKQPTRENQKNNPSRYLVQNTSNCNSNLAQAD